MLKWLRRIVIFFVLFVAVMFFGLWLAGRSAWGRSELRELLESQSARVLNGKLHVEDITGSFLNGIELKNVRFEFGGRDAFTAKAVQADYSLWGWLRGGRSISSIKVIEPVIRLAESENNWDVSGWVKSSDKPKSTVVPKLPGIPIRFGSIELVNGTLLSDANESVWRLPPEIRELNANVALTVGGGRGTRIEIHTLAFVSTTNARAMRVRDGKGVLIFSGDTKLEKLKLETDAGGILVDGHIGPTAPRTIDLNADLDHFDTSGWRGFTPLLETVALTATGKAVLGGNLERLTIRSDLKTSAGAVTADTLIASRPDHLQITGTGEVTNFDAQHVTNDANWSSKVTAHLQYVVTSSGSPSAWTADVTINGGPVRAFGTDTEQLNGKMRYAAGLVTFDALVAAYGASAKAAGTIRTGQNLIIDVTGQQLVRVDPRRLPKDWNFPMLDAEFNASQFAVHWTSGHWTVKATLDESRVEGAAFEAGTLVDLANDPGLVKLAADGRMRTLDAQRMGRATGLLGLDDPIFATSLNGHVKTTGQGKAWSDIDLIADAELTDSGIAGGGKISQASVHYTRLARFNTAHIVGTLQSLHPEAFGAPDALASTLNGQTDSTMTWRDDVDKVAESAIARGTLRMTSSIVADLPIDRGTVTGEWRDGAFTADAVQLQNSGVTMTARGRIAVTRGQSDATFELAATDVSTLEPWSGRKTRGAATGRGQLSGAFDQPRVVAAFESPKITDPVLYTFDRMTGNLDLVFPEWVLDRMRGQINVKSPLWTNAKGTLAENTSLIGTFTSRFHASTARVQALVSGVVIDSTMSADWEKVLTADIATLQAVRGTRTWRLDPSAGHLQVTSTHINASNAQLAGDVSGRLTVDGRVAWSELESGGAASDRLSMRAAAIDLAGIDEFFGLTTGAKGTLSGDATLIGRLSDPRGQITLSGRDVLVRGYKIAQVNGTIDLANGAATSALSLKQPDGVGLTANGRAPLAWILGPDMLDPSVPTPDWDLTAVSDPINLDILAALWPTVTDVSGQALVDLHVTGASSLPTFNGTLAIADGKFRLPTAGTSFSKVNLDVGFGADQVTVRRFVARDKRDHLLQLRGQLAIKERQVGGVNVHVELDRVSVLDNAIGAIELSTLMELTGDVSHPRLQGNVEIATGRVEVDRLLRALEGDPLAFVAETDLPKEGMTAVDLKADAVAAAASADEASKNKRTDIFDTKSFFSGLAVDVQVFAPDNVILRGSRLKPSGRDSWSLGDLNVTVGGELQATRAPGAAVSLRGDVTTIRGVYSFEGRRFEIQRGGRIRFQGETPVDPTFDVRGVRSIQGVEARVDVRGRLSEPRLQLGSNVPLDEADVLSMIIFNRPVNQLGDTQRADLVGAAASLAGGYVTSPLAQSLSRALDLDLLEVETVTFGQNVAPRVRVGQQLTSRLFVQLSQQFGSQSLSELTAEFQLAKFLRLKGSSAQGPGARAQTSLIQRVERAGLDLLFFFNY